MLKHIARAGILTAEVICKLGLTVIVAVLHANVGGHSHGFIVSAIREHMSFNTNGSVEVPLQQWGGLCTEMAAPDLPAGVSPDCQDNTFVPGSTRSRPALKKVFATPFPATPTVTYAKSYVDSTGVIRNLYLDSNGVLYVENLASPGVYVVLAQTTPGAYAKSITAFGREYIAVSDGLHGQEVPLQYDGTNLDRVTQDGPGAPPSIANLIIAPSTVTAAVRAANIVTVTTGSSHGLQAGYQAQITGIATSAVGTGISTIVINNEDLLGLATITTSSPHGLVPGVFVTLSGISSVQLAPAITVLRRAGGIITVITASAHGLSVGSSISIDFCPDASFNASFLVAAVQNPTSFTVLQNDAIDATPAPGGTKISINWPLPQTVTPGYFQVQTAPTSTSFTVQISYTDGTWTTGTVSYAWDGIFFVQSVISATQFTYQQYGPNATAVVTGASTCTPYGQVAPGQHQMQVLFLTRQGYTTRPSPPVKFTANGGQYLSVTNIPLGPPNVVARILAFTGALGAFFFYIPVPAIINGQQVSTATQINDNTTTAVTLDFSDNTLFAGLGISVPGNNLLNQIVLDSALGFGLYGSRLLSYGQRNRLQNMLNMGFDGGALPTTPTIPTGWTATGGGGALAVGHYGRGWLISSPGTLSQSMYLDAYQGAPIAQPNTQYYIRVWLKGGGSFTATMSSASTGFSTTATVPTASATGAWFEATFASKTPLTIPSDFTFSIAGSAVLVDELSVIYSANPYTDRVIYGSYVNNPEGFDGVSGKFGSADDTRKVMDMGIIRKLLYILTLDPTGRLHVTSDNGVTEPIGWTVDELGANCGVLSAFSLTKSQADDSSPGGGEEWFAWASLSGARIFNGSEPWKISQEIQPDWQKINLAQQLTIWTLNDPVTRRLYFGVPVCPATAPNLIYVLDYRGLETAFDIAMAQPVRVSFSGKLIATDKARKWTRWNMTMNGAALMYRPVPTCP